MGWGGGELHSSRGTEYYMLIEHWLTYLSCFSWRLAGLTHPALSARSVRTNRSFQETGQIRSVMSEWAALPWIQNTHRITLSSSSLYWQKVGRLVTYVSLSVQAEYTRNLIVLYVSSYRWVYISQELFYFVSLTCSCSLICWIYTSSRGRLEGT